MCMTRGIKQTANFLKKHQNKKEVVVWKIYGVDDDNNVYPPYRYGSVRAGTIKSNRRHKPMRVRDRMQIYQGIHVFLTRKAARHSVCYGFRRVFKCTAKIEDLVGISTYCDQAVFMKIHITPEEFDRGKKARN